MSAPSALPLFSAPPATVQHNRPSADYTLREQEAIATLHQAAALGEVTQASSLGAEDAVVTHLINRLGLGIAAFVLDTGRLHTETLALLERTQAHSRTPIHVYRPEHQAVLHFVREHGQDAMRKSVLLRKACCDLRKMEPLARALAGQSGWITGLRREQSGARAEVLLVEAGEAPHSPTAAAPGAGLAKFNPLANWSWGDVWHYIAEHGVDYNPLHDQFYPSIGCAPCTRAVTLGEDFRSGRWWWEAESAKECGLHAQPAPHESRPETPPEKAPA